MAKDMGLMATFRAYILAHILNHAQHRCVQSREHVQGFACIQKRHILRRRDNNRPCEFGFLTQCQLHISGARWQIDDQNIQFTPLHLIEHLLQSAHQHRTAPDNSFVWINHKANRHHGDAMGLQRNNDFAVRTGRTFTHAHHTWLTWTIDIGIQQAHAPALFGQGNSEI